MLFASLIFLLCFLPIAVVGTLIVRRSFGLRATLAFLCFASLVFYGWYFPPYIGLLVGSIVVNYSLATTIHSEGRRTTLALGIALNLLLLGWFKYAGFLAEMIDVISGNSIGLVQIVLPLGISFFTFQQIAYLVDIYQGKARPGKFLNYTFFVSFFPQLIAGPIVHHKGFISQLNGGRFVRFLPSDVAAGAFLFCIGLGKKVLIADALAPGADALFAAQDLGIPISIAESWMGMLCYTFQIYFDFSGYTDMALGLGLIFGLILPENFQSPYRSRDIIEFWRRWNITLSTFLRDYLYLPLGGNRRGTVRRYVNLWVVMLLGGLWHGAGLQFIVWGGLHGLFLTINHWWRHYRTQPLPGFVGCTLTFLAVLFAWVFFRAANIAQGLDVLSAMAGAHSASPSSLVIFDDLPTLLSMVVLASCLAFFAPNTFETMTRLTTDDSETRSQTLWYCLAGSAAALSLFKIFASGSYAFIYFQF